MSSLCSSAKNNGENAYRVYTIQYTVYTVHAEYIRVNALPRVKMSHRTAASRFESGISHCLQLFLGFSKNKVKKLKKKHFNAGLHLVSFLA